MMCSFESEITAYFDGELSERERAAFEAHLGSCSSCPAVLAQYQAQLPSLANMPTRRPSAQLRMKVMSQIAMQPKSQQRASFFSKSFPVLGMAAAAVLVLLVSVSSKFSHSNSMSESESFAVAQNLELLEDYDLLDMEKTEDVELVAQLDVLSDADSESLEQQEVQP